MRPVGGHTSDYATRGLLLHVTSAILAGEPVDLERLRTDPGLAGALVTPPLSHRIRRRASLARKRIIGR